MADDDPVTDAAHLTERYAENRRRGLLPWLGPMLGYPGVVWRQRALVQNFFRRELLGRFRGSVLGIFWVLAQPMFLFAVYFLVFGFVFKARLVEGEGPDPNFAVYLFSGVLIITAFLEATTRSCTAVVDNGNLVKKVAFPCELLPVHLGLVSLLVMLVGVLVMLVVGSWAGVVVPGWRLLAWPVVLFLQFVLALGIGLLLAALHVFMRDAVQIWSILGQAWMFLSPVFWVMDGPNGFRARLPWAWVLEWNPLYPIIQAHRLSLGVTPAIVDGTLGGHLLASAAWAFGCLALGYTFFMSRREKFADLV